MPHLLSLTFLSPLSLSSVLWVTIIYTNQLCPGILLSSHSTQKQGPRVGWGIQLSSIPGSWEFIWGHVVTPLRVFLSLESQAGFSVPSQDHFCLPFFLPNSSCLTKGICAQSWEWKLCSDLCILPLSLPGPFCLSWEQELEKLSPGTGVFSL